jgi:hypothetical protein
MVLTFSADPQRPRGHPRVDRLHPRRATAAGFTRGCRISLSDDLDARFAATGLPRRRLGSLRTRLCSPAISVEPLARTYATASRDRRSAVHQPPGWQPARLMPMQRSASSRSRGAPAGRPLRAWRHPTARASAAGRMQASSAWGTTLRCRRIGDRACDGREAGTPTLPRRAVVLAPASGLPRIRRGERRGARSPRGEVRGGAVECGLDPAGEAVDPDAHGFARGGRL